jgi:DNA-binding transcriptional regulator LsrR (DeoR family)
VTQQDLADCLGLSNVHANRVLQHLRREKLVTVSKSEFHILEPKLMEQLAGFDATYLHLTPQAQ